MKAISTPAIIEGIRSRKDKSLGITVSTPELSPDEKAAFFELQGLNVKLLIDPMDEAIEAEVKIEKDLEQKTQSQRIRNVLFVLWKQNNEDADFPSYYKAHTEKLINYLKSKIEN